MAAFDENGCPLPKGKVTPSRLGASDLNIVSKFQQSYQDILDSEQQHNKNDNMSNQNVQTSSVDCPPSDTCPQSASPENADEVKPSLEKMLKVLDFANSNFIQERNNHINALRESLDLNMDWIDLARVKLEELNCTLKSGSQDLDCFIKKWTDEAEHFGNMHTALTDPNYPVPNLDGHPSVIVNKESYTNLVWHFRSLCHKAERHTILIKIVYNSLEEQVQSSLKEVGHAFESASHFLELCNKASSENAKMERLFSEKEHTVKAFLQEWNKKDDITNQSDYSRKGPQCPPSSADKPIVQPPQDKTGPCPKTPHSCRRGPINCPSNVVQDQTFSSATNKYPLPLSTACPSSVQSTSPAPPSAACPTSVRSSSPAASAACPSSANHPQPGSPMPSSATFPAEETSVIKQKNLPIEDIVKQFKDLQNDVVKEVSSLKDRNDILNQSVVAMKDLPEK